MIDDLYSGRDPQAGGQHAALPGGWRARRQSAEKVAKLCGSRVIVDVT
jgi:hypothetical protein